MAHENNGKETLTGSVPVDTTDLNAELDECTEKANRLVNLLKEAKELIDSLGSTTIINNISHFPAG